MKKIGMIILLIVIVVLTGCSLNPGYDSKNSSGDSLIQAADKNPPKINLLTPVKGDHITSSVLISGTARDNGSGLSSVLISVEGGDFIPTQGLDDWSYNYTPASLNQGQSIPVVIRAADNANNQGNLYITLYFTSTNTITNVFTTTNFFALTNEWNITNYSQLTNIFDISNFTELTNYFIITNVDQLTNYLGITNYTEMTNYFGLTNFTDLTNYFGITNILDLTNYYDLTNFTAMTNIYQYYSTNEITNTWNVTNYLQVTNVYLTVFTNQSVLGAKTGEYSITNGPISNYFISNYSVINTIVTISNVIINGALDSSHQLLVNLPVTLQWYVTNLTSVADWRVVGVPVYTAGITNLFSLAIGTEGQPTVAFSDADYANKISVIKYNGASWEYLGPNGFTSENVTVTSLKYLQNGLPVIDCSSGIMQFDGTAWSTLGAFSGGGLIDVDINGKLYASYVEMWLSETPHSASSYLRHFSPHISYWDGYTWNPIGPDRVNENLTGISFGMSINPQGVPYCAFLEGIWDGNSDTFRYPCLSVVKFNGVIWESVGPSRFRDSITSFKLAISSDGIPYIAYSEFGTKKMHVIKFNGTDWVEVGNIDATTLTSDRFAFVFGPDDKPYLALRDIIRSNRLTVLKYDGQNWINWGSTAISTSGIGNVSLAFDPDGTPYVAFPDSANENKVTVMKFSR